MSYHQSSSRPSTASGRSSGASTPRSTPVPAAPYPPIMVHPPSTTMSGPSSRTVLRSSLSASPHYTIPTFGHFNHRSQSDGISSHSSHAAISLSHTATKEPSDANQDSRSRSRSFGEGDRIKSPRGGGATAGPQNGTIYRAQFCPTQQELYACINCRPPPHEEAEEDRAKQQDTIQSSVSAGRPRKLGPILLELRRLDLVTDLSLRQQGRLFSSSTLAISRGNPQLGSSVASTCLSFRPAADSNDPNAVNNRLACATGLTTGSLCVHTFEPNDAPSAAEPFEWSSSVDYFTPRRQRSATAVAWRPRDTQHVAIGLVGGGAGVGGGMPGPYRRAGGGSSRAVGGGDREFCCLVWDVGAQSQSALSVKGTTVAPVSKLSHNSGVASLAWLLEGHTLAVGGQLRTVQLYDLRVSGTSSPPVSTWAHTEAVNGIEVDPHHPHVFATFSKSVGEPVKLWDSRRMDSTLVEIKTSGLSQQQQESTHDMGSSAAGSGSSSHTGAGGVSAIRWSALYPGTLSVAIGDTIRYYDTTVSGSRPVLTRINFAPGAICDMALNPTRQTVAVTRPTIDVAGIVSEGEKLSPSDMAKATDSVRAPVSEKQCLVAELYPLRMLVVLTDSTVQDMPKFRVAPLAISRRDGRVVHALGRTVWIGSTTDGPSAMESSQFLQGEDISATMMRRARCLHKARYAMDAVANIQMLTEEQREETEDMQLHRAELLRLWSWIERVESLCSGREEAPGGEEARPWPAKGLTDAGVWRLLNMDVSESDAYPSLDTVTFSDTLSCNIYDSPMRRAALTSCGWTGSSVLADIVADCESLGEFERSAALAVWHGDIGAGVEALQRGADAVLFHLNDTDEPEQQHASARYAETLHLVSMCIAGYSGGDPNSATSGVWRRACLSLLQREDLSGDFRKITGVAYLRGVTAFLVNIGLDGGLDKVLYDEHLSLCDRVAFACRFLERRDLRAYLITCLQKCHDSGYLEGLVVTGLEKEGIAILQAYVDRCADVQTAALVSSRVVLPIEWVSERKICSEWLDSYRDLLNTWQMWQSRAMFDVARAELLRRLKGKQGATGRGGRRGHAGKRQGYPTSSSKQNDAELLLQTIPAQLDARCNYCSMSLSGLRRQEGIANSWLSKLKPVLSCCPSCRKPLPRCAICLLPMGCLNPYMELKRAGSRPSRAGPGLQTGDDLSSLANLPFAEWFTWCMRCKHGGHAHHLVGWFANHDVCPVSGCDCRCQFDGIQKLNRPALSKSPSMDGAS